MAKYIICPYCKKRIEFELIRVSMDKNRHVSMPCPGCKRRLAFTLQDERTKEVRQTTKQTARGDQELQPLAILHVVENVFGFAADFPLYAGLNRVGRYNDKHTDLEVAIRSADPSLDRNHTLITVEETSEGVVSIIMDDDSMTGTFLNARELTPGEKHRLEDGDVITLGATSLIYSEK